MPPSRNSSFARHRAAEQGVLRAETAVERLAQRGELLAERPPGELGERLWVLAARDERVEHRKPGSRTTSSAGCSMRATCGTSPAARPTWRTPCGLASSSSMGEWRPSCAPPKPIRALRNLTRYRKAQIEERTREAQRLDAEELDAWGAVARADCQDGLPQLHHPTSVGETNDTLWINGSRIRSLTH